MKNNVEFISLNWDTNYFNKESAKINMVKEINEKDKIKILSYSNKYDFITLSNFNNINKNNIWVGENTTAFLADTNIQFVKAIVKKDEHLATNVNITNNMPFNQEILNIASESFKTSRFLNDPNLALEKTESIYTMWTKNAFNEKNKYFTIYKLNNKIIGYVLFSITQSTCIIELIAVDKKSQGKHVGVKLINTIEKFLAENKIHSMQVGTQINNIPAIRFYTKMGFKYTSLTSIYHWWPKKG